MKYWYYLREYFFPSGCAGCGIALLSPVDAYYGLCQKCRNYLVSVCNEVNTCKICGKPLITENNVCVVCRKSRTFELGTYNEWITKIKTFFPYAGKFQSVLGAYKFKKSLGVGNFLAYCLRINFGEFCMEFDNGNAYEKAAWVPVPPKPGKIKRQGWDQIEFLARLLEKEYKRFHRKKRCSIPEYSEENSGCKEPNPGLPVNRCLKRLHSRSQKELNREERGQNLKGRILCIKKPPEIAFLFDDVITTGATLNACAKALLEGGSRKVYGVCLFYD